jgi:hypothetical protein
LCFTWSSIEFIASIRYILFSLPTIILIPLYDLGNLPLVALNIRLLLIVLLLLHHQLLLLLPLGNLRALGVDHWSEVVALLKDVLVLLLAESLDLVVAILGTRDYVGAANGAAGEERSRLGAELRFERSFSHFGFVAFLIELFFQEVLALLIDLCLLIHAIA